MYPEILSEKQKSLLPLLKYYSDEFILIGGTAIALQLGHRKSIDFDLIKFDPLESEKVKRYLRNNYKIEATFVDNEDELTVVVGGVKLSFIYYPFKFEVKESFENIIKMPDLITLAALKIFALGKRAKWKDYVDLYFIFKKNSNIDCLNKAKGIFGNEFNERLFREQLCYYDDVSFSEEVNYIDGQEVSNDEVKEFLREISISKNT